MKQRIDFINKVRLSLIKRKADLNDQLTFHSHEKISDGQVKDSGDEALSISMENLQNSLQQNEIDEMRLIDDALERIEKNQYGVCIDCQEFISEKRLEHFPYAARCIVCQEAFEE